MQPDKNFLKVHELMELAIRFEEDSVRYYRQMRGHVDDDAVLDLLETLERQEEEHRRILQDFELGPGPYPMLQYGPSFALNMPELKHENPGLDELLDVAIEREVRSVQIYRNTAGQVFGKLADLLNELAGFEAEHEIKLKDLRTYLQGRDWV